MEVLTATDFPSFTDASASMELEQPKAATRPAEDLSKLDLIEREKRGILLDKKAKKKKVSWDEEHRLKRPAGSRPKDVEIDPDPDPSESGKLPPATLSSDDVHLPDEDTAPKDTDGSPSLSVPPIVPHGHDSRGPTVSNDTSKPIGGFAKGTSRHRQQSKLLTKPQRASPLRIKPTLGRESSPKSRQQLLIKSAEDPLLIKSAESNTAHQNCQKPPGHQTQAAERHHCSSKLADANCRNKYGCRQATAHQSSQK